MRLQGIYRYPVKGFSPDGLESVELRAGCVLPYDRRWSVAFGGSEAVIDGGVPETWVGQRNLLSLAREPRGAQLQTEFVEDGERLVIKRNGRVVAQGSLGEHSGCDVIESFLDSFYGNTAFRGLRIVEAVAGDGAEGGTGGQGGGFTDYGEAHVSVINVNTVRDIARVVGEEVEPLRFRGNLYVEAEPWAERSWVGKSVTVGGVTLRCYDEIERCRATSVSLATGEEDINIPLHLRRGFGHMLCGVYMQVTAGGRISVNDTVAVT